MNHSDPETRASLMDQLRHEATRPAALRLFHERYEGILRGFALQCGTHRQDAEDIVQEVLCGFIDRLEGFEYDPGQGRLRGYLYKCTRNAVVKHWRRRERVRELGDEVFPMAASAIEEAWNESWERALAPRAMVRLEQEFSKTEVSRRDFAIGKARLVDGRPKEALTQEFDVTENVVAKAVHKVSKRLRDLIHESDPLDL